MKKLLLVPATLFALAGCNSGPTYAEQMQESCFDQGGVYFEQEDTSAGDHIWCVGPDGAKIYVDGSE